MIQDVYFLALHEPYEAPEHPTAINGTIVHAATLLHPTILQPDGGLMYRCLTEFPGRQPGCIVPLSTLTFELDGGRDWYRIGDWERVVEGVVRLSRSGQCDAMPLGLPHAMAVVLANGPTTITSFHGGGTRDVAGPKDRQKYLDELAEHIAGVVAQGPMWPGDNLVDPPSRPATLRYKPYATDSSAPESARRRSWFRRRVS